MNRPDKALIDAFVDEARQVSVGEAADRLGLAGLKRVSTGEEAGPCPACGGTDRFSINRGRNAWNCRGADGGHDGISLAAHLSGLDVSQREGFLAACAAALGRDVPGDEAESAEERAAREQRLAQRRREADVKQADAERTQNAYREKEIAKARGKWTHAAPIAGKAGAPVITYLTARLGGFAPPSLPFARAIADEAYWHGSDEGGRPLAIHSGTAMVLPFVDPGGAIIGCHLTWLDPAGPKGRPRLVDQETGERLPTKKMRGRKKGGLIPLIGFVEKDGGTFADPARRRFVIGEGIENVLAMAVTETARPHLFGSSIYAAAGDLGNLAGRADGRFPHSTLTNKGGKAKVQVAGPIPKPDEPADAACHAPSHVTEIRLVGDADSELEATAAAMMRAEARFAAPGRRVGADWPPAGMDFCDLLSAREAVA